MQHADLIVFRVVLGDVPMVDTLGLLLNAVVHPADVQDRDGGVLVLIGLFGLFPFLSKLFADGGYQGPQFRKELAKLLPRLSVEIVKRSDQARGFAVLPERWGCGTDFRLAQSLPPIGQGLGKPDPQRRGIHPARLNSANAAKALQPQVNFPDGLCRKTGIESAAASL